MHKNFLLKTLILVVALAAVLAVIVVTMRNGLGVSATEVGRTQTFFEQFVVAGGPIVWFVLLPMSLITVYLAAKHCLTIRRKNLLPDGIGTRIVAMIQQFGPGQLEARLADRDDFVSTAVSKAITQGKGDWFRMRSLLFESLQEQALRLLRRIEWVSLIGNVSPMVGLFGTVFGMIKLFDAIVMAGGQPQPAQLAEGISVALVTTFWGLFIAIPALAIHGVFRNRIETLANDAVVEAEILMPQIGRSLKKQTEAKQPKQKHPIRELTGKPAEALRESSLPS
jgi:biopolymer transport protein ExbB